MKRDIFNHLLERVILGRSNHIKGGSLSRTFWERVVSSSCPICIGGTNGCNGKIFRLNGNWTFRRLQKLDATNFGIWGGNIRTELLIFISFGSLYVIEPNSCAGRMRKALAQSRNEFFGFWLWFIWKDDTYMISGASDDWWDQSK